jgi:hypothetical protein
MQPTNHGYNKQRPRFFGALGHLVIKKHGNSFYVCDNHRGIDNSPSNQISLLQTMNYL